MPAPCLNTLSSRRQWLHDAFALAGSAAISPLSFAQGQGEPAYSVASWSGPVSSFALPDTAGKTWRPEDFRGRAVLLNFWATWCPPCRAEMPTLQQIADFYGPDKLLVLAINFKEPASRAVKFAESTNLRLPVLLDLSGKAAAQWDVKVFPTTLLIDARGRPKQRVKGELDWAGPDALRLIEPLF